MSRLGLILSVARVLGISASDLHQLTNSTGEAAQAEPVKKQSEVPPMTTRTTTFRSDEHLRDMYRVTIQLQEAQMRAMQFEIDNRQLRNVIHQLQRNIADLEFHLRNRPTPQPQFSQEDIKSMVRLCHPDKHANSETANRITKVLLAARK